MWHETGRHPPSPRRYLQPVGTLTQQVDDEEWPLVVLRPSTFGNDASLASLCEGLGEILDRGKRFCLLADFSNKTYMELHEVKHVSELFRSEGPRLDQQALVLALLVPSAMVRGAINLVLQARTPNIPCEILRTRQEAKRFISPYLDELTTSVTTRMSLLAAVMH